MRAARPVAALGPAVWEATLAVGKFPCLRDHQVDGEIVFPKDSIGKTAVEDIAGAECGADDAGVCVGR